MRGDIEAPEHDGRRTDRHAWRWGLGAIGGLGVGGLAVVLTFALLSSLSIGGWEIDVGPGKGTDSSASRLTSRPARA